jgi:lipid II:glycine glycyltransferase (peptidoglycan interpeptide bridge formation enzyme)
LKNDKIDKISIMHTYSASLQDIPNFKKIEASQHIVRLENVDENMLWNKLYRNRIRNTVKLARNKGVIIKEIRSEEEIKVLYRLNRETIKRNRAFYTFKEELLIDFYNNFLRNGLGKAWLAQKDNNYIAGLLVVYSNNASHGMVAGSLDEYFNLKANDLLFHEAMVDTIRNKKHYFDFMLSPQDKKKLQLFKDKFGGEEYAACIYEKNISSIPSLIWEAAWKIVHTPLGGMLLRMIYR